MYGKSIKLSSILIILVFLFTALIVLNRTATVPVSADSGVTSLIVELKGDPAAVYKAKAQKAGSSSLGRAASGLPRSIDAPRRINS